MNPARDAARDEKYLVVEEVAELLRESTWAVRTHIRRGDLPAFRWGGGPRSPYRVARSDLDAFIARRRVAAS